MKGKLSIGIIAALIAVAAGGGYYYLQKRVSESPSIVPSSAPTPAPTTTATKGDAKMSYDLTVDQDGLSKAVATMTLSGGGTVTYRFYTNDAPNTVKRITQLISEGFYNGIVIHRVVPGFVIQAGDPTGTGAGGSGQKLKAEFNSRKHVPGILSMARTSDPDSADSQFFVMLGTHEHLDGKYTVFGKTISGYEHVQKVQQGDKIVSFTIQ